MAWSTTLLHLHFKFPPVSSHQLPHSLPKKSPIFLNPIPIIPNSKHPKMQFLHRPNAFPGQGAVSKAMDIIQSSPPTWQSAFLSNLVIFVVGTPLLIAGLSLSGICAAFLLGTLTWRAFGSSGFLLVASYFVIMITPMNGLVIRMTAHDNCYFKNYWLRFCCCVLKLVGMPHECCEMCRRFLRSCCHLRRKNR